MPLNGNCGFASLCDWAVSTGVATGGSTEVVLDVAEVVSLADVDDDALDEAMFVDRDVPLPIVPEADVCVRVALAKSVARVLAVMLALPVAVTDNDAEGLSVGVGSIGGSESTTGSSSSTAGGGAINPLSRFLCASTLVMDAVASRRPKIIDVRTAVRRMVGDACGCCACWFLCLLRWIGENVLP